MYTYIHTLSHTPILQTQIYISICIHAHINRPEKTRNEKEKEQQTNARRTRKESERGWEEERASARETNLGILRLNSGEHGGRSRGLPESRDLIGLSLRLCFESCSSIRRRPGLAVKIAEAVTDFETCSRPRVQVAFVKFILASANVS